MILGNVLFTVFEEANGLAFKKKVVPKLKLIRKEDNENRDTKNNKLKRRKAQNRSVKLCEKKRLVLALWKPRGLVAYHM